MSKRITIRGVPDDVARKIRRLSRLDSIDVEIKIADLYARVVFA